MTDYLGSVLSEWYLIFTGIFCVGVILLLYGWGQANFKTAMSGLLFLLLSSMALAYWQWQDPVTIGFLSLWGIVIVYAFIIRWKKRHSF